MNERLPFFVMREYECLSAMNETPGIIELLAVHYQNKSQKTIFWFVFPYYDLGDLKHFMKIVKTKY